MKKCEAHPNYICLEKCKYSIDVNKMVVLRYGHAWREFMGDKFMYLVFEQLENKYNV